MEHQDKLIATIRWQQQGFSWLDCPFYYALSDELIADVEADGPAAKLLAPFAGESLESAYVLRLFAGIHWLALSGAVPALAGHFPSAGGDGDARGAMKVIRAVLRDPPPEVLGYLSRPPRTNEVGRAAALASGMAFIAREAGLPLSLREIGTSAGLNLRLDAYWYEQHGAGWGNAGSPVRFVGLWERASAPFAAHPKILDRRGCDRNPIDVPAGAHQNGVTFGPGREPGTAKVWIQSLSRRRPPGSHPRRCRVTSATPGMPHGRDCARMGRHVRGCARW